MKFADHRLGGEALMLFPGDLRGSRGTRRVAVIGGMT